MPSPLHMPPLPPPHAAPTGAAPRAGRGFAPSEVLGPGLPASPRGLLRPPDRATCLPRCQRLYGGHARPGGKRDPGTIVHEQNIRFWLGIFVFCVPNPTPTAPRPHAVRQGECGVRVCVLAAVRSRSSLYLILWVHFKEEFQAFSLSLHSQLSAASAGGCQDRMPVGSVPSSSCSVQGLPPSFQGHIRG
jgi:hypothetical protein